MSKEEQRLSTVRRLNGITLNQLCRELLLAAGETPEETTLHSLQLASWAMEADPGALEVYWAENTAGIDDYDIQLFVEAVGDEISTLEDHADPEHVQRLLLSGCDILGSSQGRPVPLRELADRSWRHLKTVWEEDEWDDEEKARCVGCDLAKNLAANLCWMDPYNLQQHLYPEDWEESCDAPARRPESDGDDEGTNSPWGTTVSGRDISIEDWVSQVVSSVPEDQRDQIKLTVSYDPSRRRKITLGEQELDVPQRQDGCLQGATVGGYILGQEAGRGAFGVVYRAHRATDPAQTAAVKVASDGHAAHLSRSAALQSRMDHPGVVKILQVSPATNPAYLVMEWVEGDTLATLTREPVEVWHAIELVLELLDALGAAHEQGVVHGDVKPANVLVTWSGRVKLTDFGLARNQRMEAESLEVSLASQHDGIPGTIAYMAPEQMEGQPVDGRADLYSVGVILFELITGRRPCAGDVIDIPGCGARTLQALNIAFRTLCCPVDQRISNAKAAAELLGKIQTLMGAEQQTETRGELNAQAAAAGSTITMWLLAAVAALGVLSGGLSNPPGVIASKVFSYLLYSTALFTVGALLGSAPHAMLSPFVRGARDSKALAYPVGWTTGFLALGSGTFCGSWLAIWLVRGVLGVEPTVMMLVVASVGQYANDRVRMAQIQQGLRGQEHLEAALGSERGSTYGALVGAWVAFFLLGYPTGQPPLL